MPPPTLDVNTAFNTFLGTLPLGALVVAYLLRTEHRLTRIETILEVAKLFRVRRDDTQNAGP